MSYTTILSETRSDYGGPYVYYIVEAQTANRTSSTIDVDIRVSARLGYSDSTLGTGNELFGNISVEGQSHEVTIHGYYDSWSGNTTWHPVTTSFTVTGLSNSTTSLSATFGVTSKWLNDYQDQGSLSTRTCSNISISSYTPPAPTVNTISVQPIPEFLAGYDGDSFMLTCNPSGGTGYTYNWYKGNTSIGTSQNITGTLSNNTYDNTYIYCVVTDSTGGTATTNKCEFRVGTSASQTQVSTKQVQPVRIYNGNAGAGTETWVIKSDAAGELVTTQIAFTSNGQKFTSIGTIYPGVYVVLCYDNMEVAGYDPGAGSYGYEFDDEAYRTIIFDTPPTGALLTWLQSNATKQAATVNEKDFLYGIPLIYNSGWKYNSWNITYTGNNRANIAIAGNAIVG